MDDHKHVVREPKSSLKTIADFLLDIGLVMMNLCIIVLLGIILVLMLGFVIYLLGEL